MSFNKSDGAKIQIKFSQPLVGDVSGNEDAFSITVPEYTMVPGGTIQNVIKKVNNTHLRTFFSETLNPSNATLTDTVSIGNRIQLARDGG